MRDDAADVGGVACTSSIENPLTDGVEVVAEGDDLALGESARRNAEHVRGHSDSRSRSARSSGEVVPGPMAALRVRWNAIGVSDGDVGDAG